MFRIEVQADSIPQLADQLLALGMQMSATTAAVAFPQRDTIYVAADKITAGDPVKRTRAPNKAKAEAGTETAAEQVAEAAVESMTDAARDEPEEAEVVAEPEGGVVAADLDFDKDVAPRVLDLVARKGREAMVAVLDQFGAARASEVDVAQWPELVAKLAEAGA